MLADEEKDSEVIPTVPQQIGYCWPFQVAIGIYFSGSMSSNYDALNRASVLM
jgi:hypothetical protein